MFSLPARLRGCSGGARVVAASSGSTTRANATPGPSPTWCAGAPIPTHGRPLPLRLPTVAVASLTVGRTDDPRPTRTMTRGLDDLWSDYRILPGTPKATDAPNVSSQDEERQHADQRWAQRNRCCTRETEECRDQIRRWHGGVRKVRMTRVLKKGARTAAGSSANPTPIRVRMIASADFIPTASRATLDSARQGRGLPVRPR